MQHDDDAVPGLCGEYRWYGDTHRHLTQPRLLRGHQGQVPRTAHQVRIFRSNDEKKENRFVCKVITYLCKFPFKITNKTCLRQIKKTKVDLRLINKLVSVSKILFHRIMLEEEKGLKEWNLSFLGLHHLMCGPC